MINHYGYTCLLNVYYTLNGSEKIEMAGWRTFVQTESFEISLLHKF
jgi:hypothetical protein